MDIKISEIENLYKDLFNEEKGLVSSVEVVYEDPEEGDFIKLIISLHGLNTEDATIIHTKFIFKVDSGKRHLIEYCTDVQKKIKFLFIYI